MTAVAVANPVRDLFVDELGGIMADHFGATVNRIRPNTGKRPDGSNWPRDYGLHIVMPKGYTMTTEDGKEVVCDGTEVFLVKPTLKMVACPLTDYRVEAIYAPE